MTKEELIKLGKRVVNCEGPEEEQDEFDYLSKYANGNLCILKTIEKN